MALLIHQFEEYVLPLASVVFLFVPIALYYFYFISASDLATWATWVGGVVAFIGLMLFTIILPVQLLKDPNSPYVMPDEQVEKFKKITELCQIKKG